ncbi:MAG TPA: GIY-YIG nuclease family protein [Micropepsaceae bacterium]|nr:GIY-YIG nuclease family protein [Micropepsaceae bacterium]
MMTLYVYILASKPQGTLYVGVTNDLIRRVIEHKNGEIPGFTKRYNVKRLVYYEPFEDYQAAIEREKKLKRWRRDWKRSLIEEANLHWTDLFPAIAPGFTVGPGSDAPASVRDDSF